MNKIINISKNINLFYFLYILLNPLDILSNPYFLLNAIENTSMEQSDIIEVAENTDSDAEDDEKSKQKQKKIVAIVIGIGIMVAAFCIWYWLFNNTPNSPNDIPTTETTPIIEQSVTAPTTEPIQPTTSNIDAKEAMRREELRKSILYVAKINAEARKPSTSIGGTKSGEDDDLD